MEQSIFIDTGDSMTPKIERIYRNEQISEEITYYANGKEAEHCFFKHGELIARETWHENGSRKSKDAYKDSELHGLSTRWYADGTRQEATEWQNGKMEGLIEKYHSSGQLNVKAEINGEKGHYKVWDENGQLIREFDTLNGARKLPDDPWTLDGGLLN